MSPESPVQVENISLEYRVARHRAWSLKETATHIARRDIAYDVLRAVNDVSFDVHSGDILAIIGLNVAGTSALMKIRARVPRPSAGRVRLRGRASLLIELGAGFNPERTAREKIALYRIVLGRDSRHMKARCALISEWADLTEYSAVPVPADSSGMMARLAIAVAVDVELDVLLIDEVLSVGGQTFQRKSSERTDPSSQEAPRSRWSATTWRRSSRTQIEPSGYRRDR
jgi:ABC-type polysaccharide/polyol phosphate transport system ATPase subunit